MESVERHHLGAELDLEPVLRGAQEAVQRVGVHVAGIKAANLAEQGSSRDDGTPDAGDRAARMGRTKAIGELVAHALLDEMLHVVHAHVKLAARAEARDLPIQLVSMPDVVGVQESDELTPCEVDATIPSGWRPGRLLPDHPYALAVGGGDLGASVARAVVDDDYLERTVSLGEDAVDRLAQVAFGVADGNDAGNEWIDGYGTSRSPILGHTVIRMPARKLRAQPARGTEAQTSPR
jgi:hypothetical protein